MPQIQRNTHMTQFPIRLDPNKPEDANRINKIKAIKEGGQSFVDFVRKALDNFEMKGE